MRHPLHPIAQWLVAQDKAGMDDLAWLRLQLEWGADEALAELPVDRRASAKPAAAALATLPHKLAPLPAAIATGPAAVAQAQAAAAAAGSIAALREALAGFEGCALRATATNLVFSEGDPADGLVIITDVPGAAEDRAGRPLAGAVEAFVDAMFASAGLDRSRWLTTCLVPWRPPGDRKPAAVEVETCLPFLLRHLALLEPRRVLLLGALTARVLLPSNGRRPRGVWHDLPVPGLDRQVPCAALPSVAHIQNTASAKRDAWADLLRLRRVLDQSRNDHN